MQTGTRTSGPGLGRTRTGVLLVLLTAAGVGAGEWILRGPLASVEPSDVPIEVRIQEIWASAPRRQEPRPDPAAPGQPPLPAPASPTAHPVPETKRVDDWLPALEPSRPLQGASMNTETHASEWQSFAGILEAPVEEQTEEEKAARAAYRREYLEAVEGDFVRRTRLPPFPWEQARFQIVGTLDADQHLSVIGRDFLPLASPITSLGWYEWKNGRTLPPERRHAALARLTQFEAERKEAVARVSNRLFQLAKSGAFRKDALAFGIVEGRLHVFAAGDSPRIDAVLSALASADARIREAANVLLRDE